MQMCTYRGSLGVSIWGNEEVHGGIHNAVQSLAKINQLVQDLTNKVCNLFLGRARNLNGVCSSMLFKLTSLFYLST